MVTGDSIEHSELMGAQASATANVHFQGMIHQAKSWEDQAKSLETSLQKLKIHNSDLEKKLKGKEEELNTAHTELVDQRAKKEEIIDTYMDSIDFQALMEQHDDILYPNQYTEGWNEALEAVLKRHPGLFSLTDLPSPHPPIISAVEEEEGEEDEDIEEGERILDPNVSLLQRTASPSTTFTVSSGSGDATSESKGEEEGSVSSKAS